MPLRLADAFILRTYPLKESDKIVSFFTREFGKCRGVARGARRPKSKFGSLLEPLTEVRVQYFEREGKELSNLDHCELVQSMVAGATTDLLHSLAVSVMVEVADRMLPDHEISDAVYRLLRAVLPAIRSADEPGVWLPLTYFLLWMVRLGGFLPQFEDDMLSAEMLQRPLAALSPAVQAGVTGEPGRRLRQKLKWCIEDHLESRLQSWTMLASLEPAGATEPSA
ncbi:MAG TPA: DNA repair protein RecO [Terriglobales bacterium]|nr:DNA repair protein RecO [Terriglobales bacterium]